MGTYSDTKIGQYIENTDAYDLQTTPGSKGSTVVMTGKTKEKKSEPMPVINTIDPNYEIDYPLAFSEEEDKPDPDLDAIAERWAEDRGII